MSLGLLTTIDSGHGLYLRFRQGGTFRLYLKKHAVEAALGAMVLVAIALASTAATIVFVGGMRGWLVLLAMIGAPVVLVADAGLLLYLYFSWLENRALAERSSTHRPRGKAAAWIHDKLGADLGAPPSVPWLLAAIVVGLPLLVLFSVSWKTAVVLALIGAAMPILYARVSRGAPGPAAG